MKGLGAEEKIIPLYISDNLYALNKLVKDESIKGLKKIDRLPTLAHRLLTELLQFQNDQEKCYIIGKRYLNIMDRLFRLTEDKSFVDVRYGSEYKKVQNIVKDLEQELKLRYEDLEMSKIVQKSLKETIAVAASEVSTPSSVAEHVYFAPTPTVILDSKGNEPSTKERVTIFDKTYITPVDLYNALMKKENMLIVDIRPAADFSESSIGAEGCNLINVPEEILIPGLSANTLGQRLGDDQSKEIWEKRDSFDVIVLMDWETDDFNYSGSKLERLRLCIVEWDFNRIYRQDPVVLSGGFKEFLEWYPTEVNNSHAFLSQTNSEIDELLTIDEVNYPETGSTHGNMNLKVHTITSFGDVQARIKRDFGDMEDLIYGPAARPSRSEGQLPKDFYSSGEAINPYRSLSQESIPKDYYSMEAITEPKPTTTKTKPDTIVETDTHTIVETDPHTIVETEPQTIVEVEPHKEVIYDRGAEMGENKDVEMKPIRDVQEVPKDETPDLKSAIEADRSHLLFQARATKPTIGLADSPVDDPIRLIIESLGEENKSLFKKPLPPAIDRSYKPLSVYRGVIGDGYNGLRNLRNNCYMSAMLQCLKGLPLIKSMFVTSSSYMKHIHKRPPVITLHFAAVMKALWEGTSKSPKIHYPQVFFQKVYELNPTYNRGNHEDTFEFFIFLFNVLSEDCSFDIPRPKVMTESEKSWYSVLQGRSSYFIDLFYYQLRNMKICWHCQKPTYVFDSDSTLMLPVPQDKEEGDLSVLLKEYLKENLVVEYSCSVCKSGATIVNRKSIILDPEILVIVLKRYYVNNDGTFCKNELDINFPVDGLQFGNSIYKLYSIPQHTGSMTVGHYYASVLLNDATNTWVLFNDEKVSEYDCDITEVPRIKSSCVGFFYVRQGEVSQSQVVPICDS